MSRTSEGFHATCDVFGDDYDYISYCVYIFCVSVRCHSIRPLVNEVEQSPPTWIGDVGSVAYESGVETRAASKKLETHSTMAQAVSPLALHAFSGHQCSVLVVN